MPNAHLPRFQEMIMQCCSYPLGLDSRVWGSVSEPMTRIPLPHTLSINEVFPYQLCLLRIPEIQIKYSRAPGPMMLINRLQSQEDRSFPRPSINSWKKIIWLMFFIDGYDLWDLVFASCLQILYSTENVLVSLDFILQHSRGQAIPRLFIRFTCHPVQLMNGALDAIASCLSYLTEIIFLEPWLNRLLLRDLNFDIPLKCVVS